MKNIIRSAVVALVLATVSSVIAETSTLTGLPNGMPWLEFVQKMDRDSTAKQTFANSVVNASSGALIVNPNIGDATGTSLTLGLTTVNSGALNLANAAGIYWESAPVATLGVISFNSSEQFKFTTGDLSTAVDILTPSFITPTIKTGLLASGSASNDFSASTGTFKTSSGANTLSGAATGVSLQVTGLLKTSSASTGIGYATGAGGLVTQITTRATGVTMVPNPCTSGTITTDTTSLAAEATADFIVTDSAVAIGDVVVVSIRSGSNSGGTIASVSTVTNGTFTIRITNNNAAAGTAETGAIVINFAIFKAVSS